MAVQQGWQLYWVHEDSVTKSKRITDVYGNIMSTVELDPWGANTNRSNNSAFMPQSFTSYIRDSNGGLDAMARRYSVGGSFSQPDPYGGSYDFSDPQSLNRYAYTKNDPVNFRDPTGLLNAWVISGPCPSGSCVVTVPVSWADELSATTGGPPEENQPIMRTLEPLGPGGGRSGAHEAGHLAAATNPNCITNAVPGGTLATRPSNNIEGDPRTGGNRHDGPHVVSPLGIISPVTALPAMAGTVDHAGRQSKFGGGGYPYSVVYVALNARLNGEQLVLGLVDMFYDTGLHRRGEAVGSGTIGFVQNNGNEGGLHVNLMLYSTYQNYIVRGGWTYAARQSVPVNLLIDPARDPRSPFRCP